MGKKSKAKAKGASSSAIVSAKREPCASCFAPIRDPSKAINCPGCSLIFCWRCEKKYFQACPNGSGCLYPMSRCENCVKGESMRLSFEKTHGEILPGDPDDPVRLQEFSEFVLSDLTDNKPFLRCGNDACQTTECAHCFDSNERSIVHCVSCRKVRCTDCIRASVPYPPLMENMEPDQLVAAFEKIALDNMSRCITCKSVYCMGCVQINQVLREDGFECGRCYFTKKPCTNPDCPNELGVKTQRCGDCRRSRYCSKECQIIMYPEHQNKCKRIMAKRAERDAEIEATKDLVSISCIGR